MKLVMHYPSSIWYRYKKFVEAAIGASGAATFRNIDDWRERMLTNCILYAIPVSFLALIPSVSILVNSGHRFLAAFDVFMLVAITTVTFNRRIPLGVRKAFIVVMFYLLAITLIVTLGSFGLGSIYLLALSVFISLLYCTQAVRWSVLANITIYAAFAGVIYFRLFNTPLIERYTFDYWVAYSCNFLFLNIATIIQVRHVINGLENTISRESNLREDLQDEVAERQRHNELLTDSEGHYKSLFYNNPSPMWIFDADTLAFLQVNEAAIRRYGYTREEFAGMTLRDIRPAEHVNTLLKLIGSARQENCPTQNTVVHRAKNGEEFYVEVRCNTIPFKGKEARLAIIRDISAQMEHIQAIEERNHKLQQIAFMQSHIVRAPLCRVLGLVDLIIANKNNGVDYEMMEYLDLSVKELDDVVKTIILTTDTSEDEYQDKIAV
jgi:PAS domain S-box-containing protein